MRFVIKASEKNNDLYELQIDGNFVRYIKPTEFATLSQDVTAMFEYMDTAFTLSVGDEYDLAMSFAQEKDLTNLLVNGKNKAAIDLPENLALSHDKHRVVFSSREVSSFAEYWKTQSYDKLFTLFEQLSQDLMEVPYVDEPNDSVSFKGQVAYHPNHGTTHGLRQYSLSKQYLELIQQNGSEVFRGLAESLTIEERACLHLAAFLFRVGRTNELSWSTDPNYGPRSAEIFKKIALELEFDSQLVNMLTLSFDYHKDHSQQLDLSPQDRNKMLLFTKILKLSHESDLVRCYEKYEEIKKPVADELHQLLAPEQEHEKIADSYLEYAATLCRMTGAPINALTLAGPNYIYLNGSNNLAVAWVNAPKAKENMYSLLPIRPSIFSELKSPTELWFSEPIHSTEVLDYIGWNEEARKKMPTEACTEQENRHLATHVSVYHATTKFSYALDLFCRELKGLLEKPNKTAWIRSFNGTPPGIAYKDLSSLLERQKETQSVDNTENMSWHLLSANPSLWQNSDGASEESTIDFFYDNNSVTQLKFSELINELLDKEGVLLGQLQEREAICNRFLALCKDEQFGTHGAIYHYLIPLHLVESTAYISKQNGIYDEENPGVLDTLLRLKCPDQKVSNHNTLQVRLFVPNLLNERLAEEHIIVENHLGMSQEMRDVFEERIRSLSQEAFHLSPNIKKPEVKVKERWAKYTSTFWNSNTFSKLSVEEDKARLQVKVAEGEDSKNPHTKEIVKEAPARAYHNNDGNSGFFFNTSEELPLLFSNDDKSEFFFT
ncbi:SidE phosphodiesterase domain-containing protein [Legionella lytica]|uniref:SidE phosphodiesterase domain-containing protein n=1 Tax=Legionella lytica TaxID=96232 RepID=A0ABW8D4U5_9GAMM